MRLRVSDLTFNNFENNKKSTTPHPHKAGRSPDDRMTGIAWNGPAVGLRASSALSDRELYRGVVPGTMDRLANKLDNSAFHVIINVVNDPSRMGTFHEKNRAADHEVSETRDVTARGHGESRL